MARPLKRNVLGRIACWVLVADATIGVNLGAPLFPNQEFATGGHPTSSAVGDFNGDGRQDLVVALVSNHVSVVMGRGDGSFGSHTEFVADARPTCVAVADFNGDGRQDLAVANENSNDVSILLADGGGLFGPRVNIAL